MQYGYAANLRAPAAFFDFPRPSERLPWRYFQPRSAYEIWGSSRPAIQLDECVSSPLSGAVDSDVIAASAQQVWAALLEGDQLVARRTQTFDVLVAAGVDLTVTSRATRFFDLTSHRHGLSTDLHDALLRRIRFVAEWAPPTAMLLVLDRGRTAYR